MITNANPNRQDIEEVTTVCNAEQTIGPVYKSSAPVAAEGKGSRLTNQKKDGLVPILINQTMHNSLPHKNYKSLSIATDCLYREEPKEEP